MEVLAVDHGHVDRRAPQRASRLETAEAGADDYHSRPLCHLHRSLQQSPTGGGYLPRAVVAELCARLAVIHSGVAFDQDVFAMNNAQQTRTGWSWWYLLFIIQFVLALWVPLYNKAEPSFIGIPFFYWFQLALVIVGAVLTAIVYFATDD